MIITKACRKISGVTRSKAGLERKVRTILATPTLKVRGTVRMLTFMFVVNNMFRVVTGAGTLGVKVHDVVSGLNSGRFLVVPVLVVLFNLNNAACNVSSRLIPFCLLIVPIIFTVKCSSVAAFVVMYVSTAIKCTTSAVGPFYMLITRKVTKVRKGPRLMFHVVR